MDQIPGDVDPNSSFHERVNRWTMFKLMLPTILDMYIDREYTQSYVICAVNSIVEIQIRVDRRECGLLRPKN